MKKFSKGDYFIKNKKNGVKYSLRNSIKIIIQQFEFGLEYEIIEMDSIYSEESFPQNCKYFEIYCNKYYNFHYIESKERTELTNTIIIFNLNNYKYIFIAGQRGIGKTTIMLYQFYF